MSLTALGKCISARADPSVTHVPFRDSKLTRLLQESLGGNTKTSLIINIAPCCEYLQETLSSLKFGIRAMKVGSRAILNFEEDFRVLNKNLQEDSQCPSETVHSSEIHSEMAVIQAAPYNAYDMKRLKHFVRVSAKEDGLQQDSNDVSEEIHELQKSYKKHYVDELQNEKRKVEVVAGSQLMANSAARVLKSLSLIDEFFTKK